MKEKRNKHQNNNPNNSDSNKKYSKPENSSNPLLENIYNLKKNNQIASINPDLIPEGLFLMLFI